MGASLGCCGGPSADVDTIVARYQPLELSLLQKLQRSLSTSWHHLKEDVSIKSPTGSRYGLDDMYESDDDDTTCGDSNASVTSGSRMLCDFYNLVLECDHSKFFIDTTGRRVKGPYLNEIEIIEDHFSPKKRSTELRRRRSSSMDDTSCKVQVTFGRPSNLSVMSTQTYSSELDYWSCMDAFMQEEDATSQTYPMLRGDPLESRRSLVWSEQSLVGEYPPPIMRSTPIQPSTTERALSMSSLTIVLMEPTMSIQPVKQLDKKVKQATPSSDSIFTTAAVTERRRGSMSMRPTDTRRASIVPIMAS